jgi:hypothetical protein
MSARYHGCRSGLRGAIGYGMLDGAISGGASQVALNLARGRTWDHDLGQAVFGGVLGGGVGGAIGWLAPKAVQIVGFQGVGRNAANYRKYYGAQGEAMLRQEHPLIGAGHIGVSFNKGRTIYGFYPSESEMNRPDLSEKLDLRIPVTGQVRDDTWIFTRANELAETAGWRTSVRALSQDIPRGDFLMAQRQVMRDFDLGEDRVPALLYRLPALDYSVMPDTCNNCGTYIRTLGIPIPEETGWLNKYIPLLPELFVPQK